MHKNIKLSIALLIALVGFPQISETIYTPALPAVAAGLFANIQLVEATLTVYFIGFYQEAPFVFIDQLGMRPTFYGLFGLLIAAATILAARFSYRKIGQFSAETIIQWGAFCILFGSLLFTAVVALGAFTLDVLGMGFILLALLMIFFGIGLIIPNSLSQALKPFQMTVGTAGSIFGGSYYCLIAGNTWLMSALHNGTPFPLPLYIAALSMVTIIGTRMIRQFAGDDSKQMTNIFASETNA